MLSENRFRLGVGVGSNYLEFDALAQDFTTRGARTSSRSHSTRTVGPRTRSRPRRLESIDAPASPLGRPGRYGLAWRVRRRGLAPAARLADGFCVPGIADSETLCAASKAI